MKIVTTNIEGLVIIEPTIFKDPRGYFFEPYNKEKFESFEDFQRVYIKGNKFGKVTLYSENHIWYGTNPRDFKEIKNGVTSRVFTFFKNKIYHHQFNLIETPTAYLWIQFTATPETYKENLPKFNEFIKGFRVLE